MSNAAGSGSQRTVANIEQGAVVGMLVDNAALLTKLTFARGEERKTITIFNRVTDTDCTTGDAFELCQFMPDVTQAPKNATRPDTFVGAVQGKELATGL